MTPLKALGFWIKTASLFLSRSGRSTIALSLLLLCAVSTLIFLSSMAVGINDSMVLNSVSLYPGHISGFNLPASLKRERLVTGGVRGVLRRVPVGGVLMKDGLIETVQVVGVEPEEETRHTALWKKTLKGRYPRSGEKTVFLSQAVAERLKAGPGDEVLFNAGPTGAGGADSLALSLKVSGVFKVGVSALDRFAFVPSGALPATGDKWQAAVFLDEGVDPDRVIEDYRSRLPGAPEFRSWGELMPDLRQLIDLNYVSMGIVMALVFGVVSVGIAAAFSIFILKNLREYGIMKAMGVTPGELTLLIIIEVSLLNLAASSIGSVSGAAAVFIAGRRGIDLTAFTSHNQYFAVSGVITPRLTAYSLFLPPAISFVFGIVAAVWPALLIARKKAAHILRIV